MMGKLKDVIFLREVNSLKFIIVHKSKAAHLEGGKGPVRAGFPRLTRRDGEKCSLSPQRPVWGGASQAGTLTERGTEPPPLT